jgi:hypothetical protein
VAVLISRPERAACRIRRKIAHPADCWRRTRHRRLSGPRRTRHRISGPPDYRFRGMSSASKVSAGHSSGRRFRARNARFFVENGRSRNRRHGARRNDGGLFIGLEKSAARKLGCQRIKVCDLAEKVLEFWEKYPLPS